MDDDDAIALVRAVCARLPGAQEDVLQGRPMFHVGRRRFALLNLGGSPPRPRWADAGPSLHVLTDPAERPGLAADPRFTPSPHHGDRGWWAVRLDAVDATELTELVTAAHALVARPRQATRRPVAVLTSAAHRGGKDIALGLADAGWDVVFWGLAKMATRSREVEARGGRALALLGNVGDPRSVFFLDRDLGVVFPEVDAVVHVDPNHLAFDAAGLAGAATDVATAALVARGATTVVYLDDGSQALPPPGLAGSFDVVRVPWVEAGRPRRPAVLAAAVLAALS